MPSPHFISIPKLFYADLTGTPITHCISCECDLLNGETPYVIEKALKPYDGFKSYATIFEYAMCMKCMESYQGKVSDHSRNAINQYFASNINPEHRKKLIEDEHFDLSLWVNNCLVKDSRVEGLSECQVYAQCVGDQMVMAEFPYMISGEALDEVVELLSPETLDDFNNLKDELVGPSEFQDLLKSGPRVLL